MMMSRHSSRIPWASRLQWPPFSPSPPVHACAHAGAGSFPFDRCRAWLDVHMPTLFAAQSLNLPPWSAFDGLNVE